MSSKIRSFQPQAGNKTAIVKDQEEKEWIESNLTYWANQRALYLQEQYVFNENRGWKFQWAMPGLKIAIEYQDSTVRDTQKYDTAKALGWRVLSFTFLTYTFLIAELNKIHPQ